MPSEPKAYCPKCGFARAPESTECEECGVIFEKYEMAQRRKKEIKPNSAPEQEKKNRNKKLKQCQDCGNEISKQAKKCPYCGTPVDPAEKYKLGCLIVIIFVAIFAYMTGGDTPDPASKKTETRKKISWEDRDRSIDAYIMMEGFVKKRLKSPSTAEFPGNKSKAHTIWLKNQTYRIKSYVDSQNSFGATLRTRFIGEIKEVSEDRWRLLSFEFLEN